MVVARYTEYFALRWPSLGWNPQCTLHMKICVSVF